MRSWTFVRTAALGLLVYVAAILIVAAGAFPFEMAHDGYVRAAMTYEWLQAPYFFTHNLVWLPGQTLLLVPFVWITGNISTVALLANLVAGALAMVAAIWLARWQRKAGSGTFAALLLAASPWFLFVSLTRMSEPFFVASTVGGLALVVALSARPTVARAAGASLALSVSAMTRYEGWPAVLVLAAWSLIAVWRRGRTEPAPARWRQAASTLLLLAPVALIAVWTAANLARFGVPVNGGVPPHMVLAEPFGLAASLRFAASLIVRTAPALALLAPLLLWRACQGRLLAAAAVLQLAVQVAVLASTRVHVVLVERILVLPLVLGAVAAAVELGAWFGAGGKRRWAAIALCAAQLGAFAAARYPRLPANSTHALAWYLEQSQPRVDFDTIVVDAALRPLGAKYTLCTVLGTRFWIDYLPESEWAARLGEVRANSAVVVTSVDAANRIAGLPAVDLVRVDDLVAREFCLPDIPRRYQVGWQVDEMPRQVPAGSAFVVRGRITNRGSFTWQSGPCGVMWAYHWPGAWDGERTFFSGTVEPGETRAFEMTVVAPAAPGTYPLDLDLVHERISWFSSRGGAMSRHMIEVTK